MRAYEGRPFRLTGIEIENVRCFEHVKIGLEGPNGPKSWAVILGDNGVGKTTLLRCIAIGMCDESSASGLLREIYGDWNRKVGDDLLDAEIRLTFHTDDGPARIITTIEARGTGYSVVQQDPRYPKRPKDEFPWDGIFACGYGAARRGFGSKDVAEYATIDSVYTLFNYDQPLQTPELVLRRLRDSLIETNGSSAKARAANDKEMKRLLNDLCSILMLEENSIRLDSKGLMLKGPWGSFQPIGGLGDGFQATLSWMTDLIGWALMYGDDRPLSELTGIVLIDEIEQHLHPVWQRQIIRLLHKHFPNVQFIATTHTPMCAVGTTYLKNGECKLIKLERDEAGVIAIENLRPPRSQGADQILTGFLFDMPTTTDNETSEKTARLNQLNYIKSERKLTPKEKRDLAAIRSNLRSQFSEGDSNFETTIKRSVFASLRERSDKVDARKSGGSPSLKRRIEAIDKEAAGFEAVRILREMGIREKD